MSQMTPQRPQAAPLLAMLVLASLTPLLAAANDPYPQGALAFFDLQACPEGWSPAIGAANQQLNGYFVVPSAQPVPPGTLGTTVNAPLAASEDRTHTHAFSSQVTLSAVQLAAVGGCAKLYCSTLTGSGPVSFTATTGAASSGLPYISYLFCEKTAFAPNHNPPVGMPQYLAAFFQDADCPVGWKPALTTAGRLIVALPAAGTPGLSFGGPTLKAGEDRSHAHAFSGQVSVSSYGVAGITGCCGGPFARPGTYDFSGTTAAASTGLPYVIVSQCQTCLPGDADPACLGRK
jgi:hypothetical protein